MRCTSHIQNRPDCLTRLVPCAEESPENTLVCAHSYSWLCAQNPHCTLTQENFFTLTPNTLPTTCLVLLPQWISCKKRHNLSRAPHRPKFSQIAWENWFHVQRQALRILQSHAHSNYWQCTHMQSFTSSKKRHCPQHVWYCTQNGEQRDLI